MKEFKGTKGKWQVGFNGHFWEVRPETDDERSKVINISVHKNVLKGKHTYMSVNDLETEANAKLIAAAPDLLEALQKIASNSNDHAMIRIAIKAINKAL